jgi:hypothetical protein
MNRVEFSGRLTYNCSRHYLSKSNEIASDVITVTLVIHLAFGNICPAAQLVAACTMPFPFNLQPHIT